MAYTNINGTMCQHTGPVEAPAIVLIHGLGLNHHCWQWTTPALLAAGYRVITYDLYGHGQSIKPPATPSLELFSDQVNLVLAHFNLPSAAIVGFSLGGMIARRFAQDRPDKAAAIAILFSPHKRTEEAQNAILARVTQAKSEGPASTIEAALERWFTETYRLANPDQMDLVRSWVLANDISIYHTIYRVLADGIDEIIAPNPPIKCPALVMTGDEDYGNGPEMSQAIAAEILGAELHILEGLRHMALAENPEAVNQPLTDFFQQSFPVGGLT